MVGPFGPLWHSIQPVRSTFLASQMTIRSRPPTEALLRYGAGHLGNLMDSLARISTHTQSIAAFVELSNHTARVLDVSLRADEEGPGSFIKHIGSDNPPDVTGC